MDQATLYTNTFNKNIFEVGNQQFMNTITTDFPFFALGNFYALKALHNDSPNYKNVAEKAGLFFNSPYYLQALLNEPLQHKSTFNTENYNDTLIESGKVDFTGNLNILPNNETEVSIIDSKQLDVKNKIVSPILKVETIAQKEDDILFEPLHTTDYFASQGIKFSQLPLTNDKLGIQLKSFTSWLKTMKKVHPDKFAPVNVQLEATIQNQAAKSNVDAEIVTEPMAEALIIQGKKIRAIEVYEKLSLLNPTKNAYFAAKIEHLKK